ncbi:NADPH-dependent FMN reductase [Flavobacterium sp. 9AF]|uniref:NADPH-dependent FMN reductase n=1 Tax=Flavobacterium sp. 9AF TaxID=2653142 RepID=UPI0012EF57C4|nr:NAD(P)H-dependent oxidoreductase [Flavobacterium sp. 9AF]VXB13154.1 NADPH-dependent FMN reductase [Flavobacterium sp. 9AF]
MTKKIIAFGASNSKKSINKQLATYAAGLFTKATTEVLDLNDFPVPTYSIDIEKEEGFPQAVHDFLNKIAEADLLVISMAEHNGNYTAAFKSLFDWMSRINVKLFQGKSIFLLATSPGARGGSSVLEIAEGRFPRHEGVIEATFSLPSFNDNFDTDKGVITNTDLDNELKEKVKKINI